MVGILLFNIANFIVFLFYYLQFYFSTDLCKKDIG